MNYLTLYLSIGVVVLAVIFISHRMDMNEDAAAWHEMSDAANPDREKFWYRILSDIVVPVLAAASIVAVWPVAIFMKSKELLSQKSHALAESEGEALADLPSKVEIQTERGFAVEIGDLQEELSISEIEIRERVNDPLGAVSDLPFGHFHDAWGKFLKHLNLNDEVWSFSKEWRDDWGSKEIRAGYVIVRENGIGRHFLSVLRELEEARY